MKLKHIFTLFIFIVPLTVHGNQYQKVIDESILTIENMIYDMDLCIESLESDPFNPSNEGLCSIFGDLLQQHERKNNPISDLVDSSNDAYYLAIKSKKLSDLELLRLKDKQHYISYLMEATLNRMKQLNTVNRINSAKRETEDEHSDTDQ